MSSFEKLITLTQNSCYFCGQQVCSLDTLNVQFKLPAKYKTVRSQGVPFAFRRRYCHGMLAQTLAKRYAIPPHTVPL